MMKLIRICMTLCLLAVTANMQAVPANPKPVKVQQPDGSFVTIVLRGDEWLHFSTTEDGYSVVKNAQGYYVYAEKQDGQLKATQMVAHDASQRQAAEVSFLAGKAKFLHQEMSAEVAKTKQEVERREAAKRAVFQQQGNGRRAAQYDYNNFRGLVILIEFSDKSFSRDDYASIMNDMVNKEGYTGFDGKVFTGSVHDYFSDNSLGKFQPQFDIFGPYKVSNSVFEGGDNSRAIISNAINMADGDINFKNYDRDNDGTVDMVYFIVAGNGANYESNDQRLWWPHRSYLYGSAFYKDGVKLGDYASSVELCGYTDYPSTIEIDGIGTICHEFSHVLGLPDFYDTNYATNGLSNHPDLWSVMAGGSYENIGRTPVGYSLYERWSVGFADAPQELTYGSYSLNPLYQEQQGYKIKTPKSNEYFLLENRQKGMFKWDKYLPGSGMLVHRVEGVGNQYWSNNQVNANANHMYYEVLRANGKNAANQYDVFPCSGTYLKTALSNNTSPANLLTWDKTPNEFALSDIKMQNGIITFTVSGYAVTELTITPAAIEELGVGVSQQLTVEVTPSFAQTTLTWSSDHPEIAKVNQEGMVTGVSEGTCTITVESDNEVKATCQVTVKKLQPCTIAEFKQEEVGVNKLLQLTNAEVLVAANYNNNPIAYLRDATGCIMFYHTGLDIKTNDIVSGTVYVMTGLANEMHQAIGIEGTNSEGLTITAGPAVQPREAKIDELTEADYGDLVVIKATPIERNSGLWVPGDNNRARVWAGQLGITPNIPSGSLEGLYFDVTGIYAADRLNNATIHEIHATEPVKQVEAPTGITAVHSASAAARQYYNLNGQRVAAGYKGLVIINGKKLIKK